MKREMFWSLFGPQLIILIGCIVGLALYIWQTNRQSVSQEWLRVLETQAALAAQLVVDDTGGLKAPESLHDVARQLLRETGHRLTLVRPDGVVLMDSEARHETMLRHDDRPEIIEALRKGYGHSERYSTTLNRMMHYVARTVNDASGKPLAVVRVAVPRQAVAAPIRRSMAFFALLLVGIVVTSVGLSYVFARRVTVPVAEMRDGLARLGAGELSHRLRPPAIRHLAALAQAINDMGVRLDSQVHQLEAERALREGILTGIREGVIALDGERRIVMINASARRLLGLLSERAIDGQPLDLAVPCAELLALVDSATADNRPLEAEIHVRETHRTSQLWAATSRWRSADGSAGGTLILLNDLTQIRRLEQIRRDFVSNVSHELRTPVTSIKGFTETLLDEPPPDAPTSRHFLRIIRRQTEQLQMILNDMLLLARLEDSGMALQLEPVDAQTLVEAACGLCASRAQASQVVLHQHIPESFTFQGHAHLLEQALVNLIDNAIKYGGEKKTVTVQAALRNQTITFTVQDQGAGIDQTQAERIFERFYRIDSGRSRDQGGTGLGLAVVKHVVRVHLGTVTVENLPEGGCAFRIQIPFLLETSVQAPDTVNAKRKASGSNRLG